MALFPTERTCAICGKVFLGFNQWVYKRGEIWYCSYHCKQEAEKRRVRRSKGPWKLTRVDRGIIRDLLEMGEDPKRIAKRFGVTVEAIQYHQRKMEDEKNGRKGNDSGTAEEESKVIRSRGYAGGCSVGGYDQEDYQSAGG